MLFVLKRLTLIFGERAVDVKIRDTIGGGPIGGVMPLICRCGALPALIFARSRKWAQLVVLAQSGGVGLAGDITEIS
jgi:hypothetical protein